MASTSQQDIIMEQEEEEPIRAPKRKVQDTESTIVVDPDNPNDIVGTAKKPRIELNEAMKIKCIRGIVSAFLNLFIVSKVPKDAFINLNVGSQIINIIFSVHSILRQEKNETIQDMRKKAEKTGFKVVYLNKEYPVGVEEATNSVIASFTNEGLKYEKFDSRNKENWYGTIGPYLNFFTGFSLRKKELRLGHAQMAIGKESGRSKTFMVEKYGIHGGQHILLEGCTFPPEKRSSMVQSMGPLTILLQYIRSEPKYADKWRAAAKRTFAFIPEIDQILKEIQNKPAHEVRDTITLVGDISRVATTRQATRAFLPINFVALVCADRKVLGRIVSGAPVTLPLNGEQITLGPSLIKYLNFSGHGAFLFWELCSGVTWSLHGEWTPDEAKQVIYHCTFGTFKEDLGVLASITNCGKWLTREDFGSKFQKNSTSGKQAHTTLIKQVYWSKLTSASQTKLLAGTYYQDSSLPCFSGARRTNFTNDFFENIARKTGRGQTGKTHAQLLEILSSTLNTLLTQITKDDKTLEMGTTNWFDMSKMTLEDAGAPVSFVAEAKGLHFLGKRT